MSHTRDGIDTLRSWLVERVPHLWALWAASRPSQLALIGLLYALGVGMATTGRPVAAATFVPRLTPAVLVGGVVLLAVAVAVHYANEYADADTDALADRTPFSGGSGALAETGLPASFLGRATLGTGAVAVALLAVGGVGPLSPIAVALAATILVAGVAYSLPPVALVRRGLGEPVNMVLGGLLLPVYGVAVVAPPTPSAAAVVVPFTLVVGCNLLAVHWPDRAADERVGKRTLAVRWGPTRLRRAYAALAVSAALATLALWRGGLLPPVVAAAHLTPVPFLLWGWTTLTRRRSPLPAVAAMVVLAVALTAGWWWAGV
ncbi:prenyltransferase [Halosegnis longus]|uniref:Prenyltransferase n=1 Tax=Halosegnis longus TaxID=2216012 RepID=A0AAJ4RB27_9EURY|nr:prenyltransferase [Halosegnis longus]RNJ27512.1 prenyltransferase [Salella cibi]